MAVLHIHSRAHNERKGSVVKDVWGNMVIQLLFCRTSQSLCSECPRHGYRMQLCFPGVLPTNSTQAAWGRNRSLVLPSCP